MAIPQGCELKQIAVQLSDDEIRPGDKRYIINLDLWNKLDSYNKMALVLHEALFREQREQEKSSSMTIRGLIGQIIREKTDPMAVYTLYAKDRIFIRFSEETRAGELFNLVFDSYSFEAEESNGIITLSKFYYSPTYHYNGFKYKARASNKLEIDSNTGLLLSLDDNLCQYLTAGEETSISLFKVAFPKASVSCGKNLTLASADVTSALIKAGFYEANLFNVTNLNSNENNIFFGNFQFSSEVVESNGEVSAVLSKNSIFSDSGSKSLKIKIGDSLFYSSGIYFLENSNYVLVNLSSPQFDFKLGQLQFSGEIACAKFGCKLQISSNGDFITSGHFRLTLSKAISVTFKSGLTKKTATILANEELWIVKDTDNLLIPAKIDGERKYLRIDNSGKIKIEK